MKEDGTAATHASDALYQIPVIKVSDLAYGKYTAKITVGYNEFFDHNDDTPDYDFYLDAIRIYDPTGNLNKEVNDVYVQDGEGWPVYQEMRNNVIAASDFKALEDESGNKVNGAINGIAFIDTNETNIDVSDYISYGPNNELYLAKDQMIVFGLDLDAYIDKVDRVNLGIKSADGKALDYAIVDADDVLAKATELIAAEVAKIEEDAVNELGEGATEAEKQTAMENALVSLLKNYDVTDADITAEKNAEAFEALEAMVAEQLTNAGTYTDPALAVIAVKDMEKAAIAEAEQQAAAENKTLTEAEKQAVMESALKDELKTKYSISDGVIETTMNAAKFAAVESLLAEKLYPEKVGAVINSQATSTITTTTDMYYDITDLLFKTEVKDDQEVRVFKNPLIVIRNAGEGIMSLTNIKVTFKSDPGEIKNLFYVDYETIMKTLMDPEITIPSYHGNNKDVDVENDNIKMTLTVPETVIAGEAFEVVVTTTKPVNNVEIESQSIAPGAVIKSNDNKTSWVMEVILYEIGDTATITATAEYGTDSTIVASTTTTVHPAVTVKVSPVVLANDKYVVTITTNADSVAVSHRGTPVPDSQLSRDAATNTWTCELTAGNVTTADEIVTVTATTAEVSTTVDAYVDICYATVEIDPYDEDGKFVPQMKTGEAVTFTVTTDEEIELVTIYGEPVTTYRTDENGNRIWTAKYSWDDPGTYTVDVTLSHIDGYELDIVEETISVVKPQQSQITTVVQNIRNVISWVASTLRSLFSW